MPKQLIQAPKGMHDILPQDQQYWNVLRAAGEAVLRVYGFERIDVPLVEAAELFLRGVGAATDLVEKQMYSFKTRGGDELTLRPEMTASVARAYIEHGMHALPQPIKLWYQGPVFRHENPQFGRYRQHWQLGAETLGEDAAVLDAEVIQALYAIYTSMGLSDVMIQINSIGDAVCRPGYRKALVNYYKSRREDLCKDCKRRFTTNPLRLLDCKEPGCQELRDGAPQIVDYLCEKCHKHFREVLEFLDEAGLPYILNAHLVRGLDYYTRTVFEFFMEGSELTPIGAIGGGGRYDELIELLGGKPTPAVGGVIGMDRVVDALRKREGALFRRTEAAPRVFLAQLGDLGKKRSLKLFEELRRAGLSVAEAFSKDSLKVQLRIANRLGVEWALILGEKEAIDGSIIAREMTSGIQETLRLDQVVSEMKKRIKK
ncbi:MAG: histidine--tRNA ligase [bacterium]|nr:histidine--tRNA ligase [bacterium]MDZ4295846.1 histidine--tRNA ligase [Patescibacteria group bacterium]MDZ4295867.1 histidine--tRNA ligase [Patescibacteria group bacterium]